MDARRNQGSIHPLLHTYIHTYTHTYTHIANICRVGQNRIYTPYMTVYLVISLTKIPYTHRIYMVLANPKHMVIPAIAVGTVPDATAAAVAALVKSLGPPAGSAFAESS